MTGLNYAGISAVDPLKLAGLEEGNRPTEQQILKIDRRSFLKLTGIVGGGLMLSFATTKVGAQRIEGTLNPNGYIKIDADGIVLFAKNPEIGQGVKTSLPMIIAEELDAAWDDVTVVQSAVDQQVYGSQFAGGSTAIPMNFDTMRRAGATARSMLVEAAARRWNVPGSELTTRDTHVWHAATDRYASYMDLSGEASRISVPDSRSLTLKSREDFRLLGKRITGVDNDALVRGEPLFGIDQTVPGMKFAVYQKCPAIGGRVESANLDEIKELPGVFDAFILEGNGNVAELLPGVAIVANSTWEAMNAKKALMVVWDESEASKDSWSQAQTRAKELANEELPTVGDSGDFEAAMSTHSGHATGFYSYHFVSHVPMEPQNATASFADGKLEIWAPVQVPAQAMVTASTLVGIHPRDAKIHQTRCGGGFGRRLNSDFVSEAAAISKQAGIPVKLQWTREDDIAYDLFRTGGFHQMDGCVDDNGKIAGWRDRFITFSHDGQNPVAGGSLGRGSFPSGLVDNVRIEQMPLEWKNRCGYWRAPGSCTFAFVMQSFLHELADIAGRDHLDVLLEVLGEPRQMGGRMGMHTGRASTTVKLAAEKAGWGKELPPNHGMGIAFYFSHSGHFTEVAEVSVEDTGTTIQNSEGEAVPKRNVTVHRVTVAADVGPIINLSGAENQVQGSVVDGLSTMLTQSLTFEQGRVEQTNFDRYPMLRMKGTPAVDVHFVDSDYPPTGLGEPALPPLAPAVCNAIFVATGHRIRTMPISEEGFFIS